MIYKPVKVKDRELIDGGILSTTNLDIAVEAGAKFIVVVNPLVPYVNDFEKQIPTLTGSRAAARVRHGLPPDRLPGVQAAGLPAPARDRAAVGGPLPRRRHHPDRARAQRRADVPDERHELHLTRRHRPARLPVGDAQAGPGLSRVSSGSAPATGSRSRPPASARSSSTSRPSARRRGPGARFSSRQPRRCCGSPHRARAPKPDRSAEPPARRRPNKPGAAGPLRNCPLTR